MKKLGLSYAADGNINGMTAVEKSGSSSNDYTLIYDQQFHSSDAQNSASGRWEPNQNLRGRVLGGKQYWAG